MSPAYDPLSDDVFGLVHDLLPREEERDLLVRAKSGCESARERLLRSNLKTIWKVAIRFGGGADAKDRFQIGSIAAWEAIPKADPERRLAPYLMAVAKNAMWNASDEMKERERSRRGEGAMVFSLREDDDTKHSLWDYEDPESRVLHELSGDSDPDEAVRNLILARFYAAELPPIEARSLALNVGLVGGHAHTQREIGEKLGIARETARDTIARATTKLRAAWAVTGDESWPDALRKLGVTQYD